MTWILQVVSLPPLFFKKKNSWKIADVEWKFVSGSWLGSQVYQEHLCNLLLMVHSWCQKREASVNRNWWWWGALFNNFWSITMKGEKCLWYFVKIMILLRRWLYLWVIQSFIFQSLSLLYISEREKEKIFHLKVSLSWGFS